MLDELQSFIIHESTIRMSSQLNDQQLGRLIRHFYLYISTGQTPDAEKNLAVSIIFNEWRLRYDIDKQQYETVCQKRSVAARKGLAKRWERTDDNAMKTNEDHAVTINTENGIDMTSTEDCTNTSSTENGCDMTPDSANDSYTTHKIANDSNAMQTIANIADNDSNSDYDSKKETSPEGEAKKKISLTRTPTVEARKNDFYKSMVPYAEQYDREMLNDFFQYWTELDKRLRRMRFEMQKTWETGKRLATWERRQNK